MDGVENADVDYEAGWGVVEYDPAAVTPEAMIDELERMTGFVAAVTDEPVPPLTRASENDAGPTEHEHSADDGHRHEMVDHEQQ